MIEKRFENASVVIAGAACLPVLFSGLQIPGFRFCAALGYSILCFWVGLLLGSLIKRPRRWVSLLILCIALFGLLRYRQVMDHGYQFVHTAMSFLLYGGFGFLFSSGKIRRKGESKGGIYLLFLLVLGFCWCAVSVIHSRLTSDLLIPEHQDMERLMENLSRDAELLLQLSLLYCLAMLSFSKAGQWLGSQRWFRGIVLVPIIVSFFVALFRFRGIRFDVINKNVHLREQYLIPFLVQPLTVWLVISISRWAMDKKK